MSDDKSRLLDPRYNDLIPSPEGEAPAPAPAPELSPDYIEPQARPDRTPAATLDAIEDTLHSSRAEPCGFDDGLMLRRDEGGGLHVWKGDRIVRDLSGLDPDELRTIKNYIEGSR